MEPERFSVVQAAMKQHKVSFLLGFQLDDLQFSLDMLAAGRMCVDPLRTATVTIDELPAMFAALQQPNEHGKVVVSPYHANGLAKHGSAGQPARPRKPIFG